MAVEKVNVAENQVLNRINIISTSDAL